MVQSLLARVFAARGTTACSVFFFARFGLRCDSIAEQPRLLSRRRERRQVAFFVVAIDALERFAAVGAVRARRDPRIPLGTQATLRVVFVLSEGCGRYSFLAWRGVVAREGNAFELALVVAPSAPGFAAGARGARVVEHERAATTVFFFDLAFLGPFFGRRARAALAGWRGPDDLARLAFPQDVGDRVQAARAARLRHARGHEATRARGLFELRVVAGRVGDLVDGRARRGLGQRVVLIAAGRTEAVSALREEHVLTRRRRRFDSAFGQHLEAAPLPAGRGVGETKRPAGTQRTRLDRPRVVAARHGKRGGAIRQRDVARGEPVVAVQQVQRARSYRLRVVDVVLDRDRERAFRDVPHPVASPQGDRVGPGAEVFAVERIVAQQGVAVVFPIDVE